MIEDRPDNRKTEIKRRKGESDRVFAARCRGEILYDGRYRSLRAVFERILERWREAGAVEIPDADPHYWIARTPSGGEFRVRKGDGP